LFILVVFKSFCFFFEKIVANFTFYCWVLSGGFSKLSLLNIFKSIFGFFWIFKFCKLLRFSIFSIS